MEKEKKSLRRKAAEVGGWHVVKRFAKSVPYLGGIVAISLVGYDIRKKGVVRGVINSGLDAIPFVGTAKNVVEFFAGDLLPDKKGVTELYQREEFLALEKKDRDDG